MNSHALASASVCGFMEVIQGLVGLFHRAKGPLHLAFGTGRGPAAIVAAGQMRLDLDVQIVHDPLKHVTLRHRTIIGIEIARAGHAKGNRSSALADMALKRNCRATSTASP